MDEEGLPGRRAKAGDVDYEIQHTKIPGEKARTMGQLGLTVKDLGYIHDILRNRLRGTTYTLGEVLEALNDEGMRVFESKNPDYYIFEFEFMDDETFPIALLKSAFETPKQVH